MTKLKQLNKYILHNATDQQPSPLDQANSCGVYSYHNQLTLAVAWAALNSMVNDMTRNILHVNFLFGGDLIRKYWQSASMWTGRTYSLILRPKFKK